MGLTVKLLDVEKKIPSAGYKEKFTENSIKVQDFIGIPYRGGYHGKNGLDCAYFLGYFMLKNNIIKKIEKIEYSNDWHLYKNNGQIMIKNFNYHLNNFLCKGVDVVKTNDIGYGDIIFFSMVESGLINHCAIKINDSYILHSIEKSGVCISSLGRFKDKIIGAYKIWVSLV